MGKTVVILGLILCATTGVYGQIGPAPGLSQASEETRMVWQMRYDSAQNRKSTSWIYIGAGGILLAFGGVDYARRFDEIAVPGNSYDAIRCSGGVCVNVVVREPSTVSRVENPARRNLAIASLAGGAALSLWGLIRAGNAGTEMRRLEEQRRKWGSISLAPGPAGRGWLICYQRTF
jgi:hypothetical protein